ncbi:MAG: sulfotransferase, partial [Gemmatimonadota bacterium]
FIGMVRNGYAVAEGIRRKARPKHLREGWPLDLCVRQWTRSNEILLEDSEALDRVLWVRYEDLAARPENEVQRILRFLDLDARNPAIDLERSWAVHEREEPIRDMNPESIARLSADEIRAIGRMAGPMLERFGYEIL